MKTLERSTTLDVLEAIMKGGTEYVLPIPARRQPKKFAESHWKGQWAMRTTRGTYSLKGGVAVIINQATNEKTKHPTEETMEQFVTRNAPMRAGDTLKLYPNAAVRDKGVCGNISRKVLGVSARYEASGWVWVFALEPIQQLP